MSDLSDVFRDRHYGSGHVYIAGSLEGRLLKIGSTINIDNQGRYLRNRGYAGLKDWVLLYFVKVSSRGKVEHDARRNLPRIVRDYIKDGNWQRSRECVSCDFSVALEELSQFVTDEERKHDWRSSKCGEYEFRKIFILRQNEALARMKERLRRDPIPFDSIHQAKIESLNLSPLLTDYLKHKGFNRIGDLIQQTEFQLLLSPKFGNKSLKEVNQALALHNLRIGVKIINWPEEHDGN